PFLRDISTATSNVKLAPRVAVTGGGNTASDCARQAIRQGAGEGTVITDEGSTSRTTPEPDDAQDMTEEAVRRRHERGLTRAPTASASPATSPRCSGASRCRNVRSRST